MQRTNFYTNIIKDVDQLKSRCEGVLLVIEECVVLFKNSPSHLFLPIFPTEYSGLILVLIDKVSPTVAVFIVFRHFFPDTVDCQVRKTFKGDRCPCRKK